LVQLKLVDKGSLRFSACQQRDSQQERDEGPCSCDANGAALPIRDMQAHRWERGLLWKKKGQPICLFL